MKRLPLAVATFAAGLTLASCGGGGSGSAPSFVTGPGSGGAPSTPNPASGPTAPPSIVGTASLSILIPNATSTSSTRRSAYVSAATKSVAVFASPASATPPPAATTVANVGAGAPGCTSVAAGTSCTITVPAQYGQMTFTIKTYDGVLATGNLLSSATIVQTIGPNQAPIPVALSGVVAGVTLALTTFSVPAGGGTLPLAVNATDANGAVIGGGGTYTVPVTLSASDPTVTFSPAVVTGPGQTVTVTYTASTSSLVTINATAQGISANAIQSAAFSVAAPSSDVSTAYLLADYPTTLYEFPAGSSGNVAPTLRFSPVTAGGYVLGFAADASGHVAFSEEFAPNYNGVINVYSSNGTFFQTLPLPHTPTTPGTGYVYAGGLSFDQSGNLVVGVHAYQYSPPTNFDEIDTFANGSSTPIRSISGNLTNFSSSQQISVDASGRIFVLQSYPTTVVTVYPAGATGNVSPTKYFTVPNSAGFQSAMAVAPDGTLAILEVTSVGGSSPGQTSSGQIFVYSPTGALVRTITGGAVNVAVSTYSFGMAFDANDNLYIPSSNTVYVFGPNAAANATPIRTFGGSLAGGAYFSGVALGTAASSAPSSTVITGDMLALAPNRTWNYAGTPANGSPFTVSLYNDPQPVNGNDALVLFAKASAGADAIPADGGTLAAAAGLTSANDGYHAQTYGSVSNDSYGLIPGAPLLVPNSLTLGQTFVPFPGITATVTFIGAVPGMNACTNSPAAGVTVVYTVYGGTETVSYVPGCGVTNVVNESGTVFTLTSIASHPEIGEQSFARHVLHANYGDTLRTLWQRVLVRH